MTTRLSDRAVQRAAVAMLRSLGATEVVVRTAVATGSDQRGLGLERFEVAEVRLANALVRQTSSSPLKLEIVVPSAEVEDKLGVGKEEACDALHQLVGVSWGDHLLRVVSVLPELVAGRAYLYRISAEE